MKGIDKYRTKMGLTGVRVNYSADPDKDPSTESGKRRFDEAVAGYVGGILSSAWREEMEIDWDAAGGELVFPILQTHKDKIVVPPFDVPEDWRLYGSFDYGHRNPASFHVYAMDYV